LKVKSINIKVICFILLIFFPVTGFAELDWVKEVKDSGQNWPVSKDASQITLYHTEDIYFSSRGRTETYTRKMIKIQKPADGYFVIPIGGITPFCKIRNLKGLVIQPDGKTKRMKKENIIRGSPPAEAGYYDDVQILYTRFDHLRAGTIIAVDYTTMEKDWMGYHQSIEIQDREPVFFVRVSANLPRGWQLHHVGWRTEGLHLERGDTNYTWTGEKLDYQVDEPLIPSPAYLTRYFLLSCYDPSLESKKTQFADWASVVDWEIEISQVIRDDAVTSKARALTTGLTEPGEKLDAIARFVRDEIRYVAVEIGKGRWYPRPAAKTLYNRYGDCKDKAALMRAMLEATGIPSVSVLANAGSYVDVNEDLPSPAEFDHVIVAVPLKALTGLPPMPNASAGGWLFFDPTYELLPLGQLPDYLQGSIVLPAAKEGSELIRLPYSPPDKSRRKYDADIELMQDGSFTARVRITDFENRAFGSRQIKSNIPEKDRISSWLSFFSEIVPNIKLSEYKTGQDDETVWTAFTLKSEDYIQYAGPYILLKPDIFHAVRFPDLNEETREFPVWLGPARRIETDIAWTLPENWAVKIEGFPIHCAGDVADLEADMNLSEGKLRYHLAVSLNGHRFPVERYTDAQTYIEKINHAESATLFLQKP